MSIYCLENQWEASDESAWKDQYDFSGGGLGNYVGTSGITRSSVKWDRGPVLFSHKEWRKIIMWMKRSLENYPR